MHKNLTFLFLILVVSSVGSNVYKKVIPNYNPEARCLDGSPAFLYVSEGSDLNNIMIYFLGGGDCGSINLEATLDKCYERSKGLFGSSTKWE